MKVRVEACWGGGGVYHSGLYWMLTRKDSRNGHTYTVARIYADNWDRKAATEALDLIESLYNVRRSSVRFMVR